MISPNDIDRIFAAAERDADAGNWAAARAGYLQVLARDAAHADAMLQLSYAESLDGHYRLAREWALRAAAGELPQRPEAMIELVRRLRTFNEVVVLHGLVGRWLENPRTHPAVLVEAARQLNNLNDFGSALRCAEVAVAKAPGSLDARLVRGMLLAHHARLEAATADIEWTLARNPRIALAWWMLARLRKQTLQSNHVAQLRALLAAPGISASSMAAVARALHKELDDIGDHEGAWRALVTMCKARRSGLKYDPADSHRLVDALVRWSPGCTAPASGQVAEKTPIFIVGMYRSGTTLLEQLLDASPQVRGIGELNDFTSAMRHATDHYCKGALDRVIVERAHDVDFAEVGRRYLDGIAWRVGGEACFTDKLPANFLNVGFICRALPRAKILHLVRDPVETLFSNLRELFSDVNPHSYEQLELADYFLQYRRLMAHWHAVLPGRILDVNYARLTADPESVMREVAAFCGVDYVAGMRSTASSKRAVATASSVQVRGEVTRRDTPKWAPYAHHLRPLIDALRAGGVDVPGTV